MCAIRCVSNFKIYELTWENCNVYKPVFSFLMIRSNRICIRAIMSFPKCSGEDRGSNEIKSFGIIKERIWLTRYVFAKYGL